MNISHSNNNTESSKSSRAYYIDTISRLLENQGLVVQKEEYNHYRYRIDKLGSWLWRKVMYRRIGEHNCVRLLEQAASDCIPLENSIIRVLGFGYDILNQLLAIFMPKCAVPMLGLIEGSLFNLSVSFYDTLCDELNRECLVKSLITLDYLKDAFLKDQPILIDKYNNTDIYLHFLKLLIVSFFSRWQLLVRNSCNPSVAEDSRSSIIQMYLAQSLLQKKRNILDNQSLIDSSRIKSCLPTWVMFELALLSQHQSTLSHSDFKKLKIEVMNFAEILWLTDDLVDVFEDAAKSGFNIFLQSINFSYREPPKQDQLNEIAVKGVFEIRKCYDNTIRSICNSRKTEAFILMVKCLLRSWLT